MEKRSLAPLTGALFVVLVIIAFVGLGGNTPDGDASAQKVVRYYTNHDTKQIIAAAVLALGMVPLAYFASYVRERTREVSPAGSALPGLAFAGGIIAATGFLVAAGIHFALADYADDVAPVAAQAINALDADTFLAFSTGVAIFVFALGLIVVRTGFLPKWLGWVAIALFVISFSPVGFVGFGLGGLWIIIVSVMLYLRGREHQPPLDVSARFRAGVRAGIPFALAGSLVAASFGVLARDVGFTPFETIAMSAIVFAGSAQFAAIAIIGGGGGVAAAVGAAALMNSRFLPMGVAFGPSLPGGPGKRALQGQAVVDASWVIANQGDGTFDRWLLFGASAPQYVSWLGGTIAGVYGGSLLGDPNQFGIAAVFPAFFLVLLMPELRSARGRKVALLGAAISLALVPFTPAGVPVLAASAAALIGLFRGAREEARA